MPLTSALSPRARQGGAPLNSLASRQRRGGGEGQSTSRRIVKDDAEREAPAGAQPADPMAHRHPIGAAGTFDRAVVDREDAALALPQRHDFAPRLRSRTLLD